MLFCCMKTRIHERQDLADAKVALSAISSVVFPFQTDEACLAFLFHLRFPSVQCPRCRRINAYHKHPTKPCYTCNCGRSHIFPMKGTMFEKSRLALPLLFRALSLLYSHPNLPVQEVQQLLGVTYATAWRLVEKIGLPCARAQQRPAYPSAKHLRSSNEDLLQAL